MKLNEKVKHITCGVVVGAMLATAVPATAAQITKSISVAYNNIKIVVDGQQVSTDKNNEPFIYNGTTYLPIRAVGQAVGKQVSWDGNTNTVYLGDSPILEKRMNIPKEAVIYNGHSYYVYSGICSSWEEAAAFCESMGGHLAVINDAAENVRLFEIMKEFGYNNAYFGFSDVEKEGNWKWVNGDAVTYTNWNRGEPNNERNKENYALFYHGSEDYYWNDGDFHNGTVSDDDVFICEWDGIK